MICHKITHDIKRRCLKNMRFFCIIFLPCAFVPYCAFLAYALNVRLVLSVASVIV